MGSSTSQSYAIYLDLCAVQTEIPRMAPPPMKFLSFLKPPMKTCFRCGDPKPASQFQKDSTSKDGLRARCKDCRNEVDREKRREITKGKTKKSLAETHIIGGQDEAQPSFPEGDCALLQKTTEQKIQEEEERVYPPKFIVAETDASQLHSIFQKIQEKHNAPVCITYYKTGKYRVQIHSSPTITHKGDIEDILPNILRGDMV